MFQWHRRAGFVGSGAVVGSDGLILRNADRLFLRNGNRLILRSQA